MTQEVQKCCKNKIILVLDVLKRTDSSVFPRKLRDKALKLCLGNWGAADR